MQQPRIWLSTPHMSGNELAFVNNAFETNWIAPLGPNVNGFEKDLSEYTNSKQCAALSCGTAAIHLALIILGVKPGDEVICQSFTFSATANPISYLGATPVFIDSEPDTWNMCPKYLRIAIEERIKNGKKPKAIMPVHLYGMPAKMDEIISIAREFQIPIVEDAAEALGSKINGKACGTFGDMGILSFNGNKIITTSGGGALISDNESYIIKARFLATQARDNAPHYQHSEIGYNYRMSNVLAGVGRGQMIVLNDRVKQRRANFDFYREQLSKVNGISFRNEPDGFYSNRWLSAIEIDPSKTNGKTREDVRLELEKFQIESRPLWKPMHLQPVFEKSLYYGTNVSEDLFNNGLCLPSGSNLKQEELQEVIDVIKNVLTN